MAQPRSFYGRAQPRDRRTIDDLYSAHFNSRSERLKRAAAKKADYARTRANNAAIIARKREAAIKRRSFVRNQRKVLLGTDRIGKADYSQRLWKPNRQLPQRPISKLGTARNPITKPHWEISRSIAATEALREREERRQRAIARRDKLDNMNRAFHAEWSRKHYQTAFTIAKNAGYSKKNATIYPIVQRLLTESATKYQSKFQDWWKPYM